MGGGGTFSLGESLADARDELGRLKVLNKGWFDWDAERAERAKAKTRALTLGEWLDGTLTHGERAISRDQAGALPAP